MTKWLLKTHWQLLLDMLNQVPPRLESLLFCRYLQEIGYTDTIIDVRSARVRSLLGLQAHAAESEAEGAQPAIVQMNGELPSKRAGDQGKAR